MLFFLLLILITAEDNSPPDRKLTRSMVASEQGKLLVGEKAYNQLKAKLPVLLP